MLFLNHMVFLRSLVATSFAFGLFFCGTSGNAAASQGSYDATVLDFAHGFLIVIDLECHHHDLTSRNNVSMDTLRAWGWKRRGQNVHISFHYEDQVEIADEIYPSDSANVIGRCAKEERSFETHVDGKITQWSEGNAIGSFDLATSTGATRTFGFAAGKEPSVDGRRVVCLSGPDPDWGCSSLKALIKFNRTKVRVYYKVIDAPDGPREEVIRIQII